MSIFSFTFLNYNLFTDEYNEVVTEWAALLYSQVPVRMFYLSFFSLKSFKTLSCLYPVGFNHLVPDVLGIQPVISRQVVSSGINSFKGF